MFFRLIFFGLVWSAPDCYIYRCWYFKYSYLICNNWLFYLYQKLWCFHFCPSVKDDGANWHNYNINFFTKLKLGYNWHIFYWFLFHVLVLHCYINIIIALATRYIIALSFTMSKPSIAYLLSRATPLSLLLLSLYIFNILDTSSKSLLFFDISKVNQIIVVMFVIIDKHILCFQSPKPRKLKRAYLVLKAGKHPCPNSIIFIIQKFPQLLYMLWLFSKTLHIAEIQWKISILKISSRKLKILSQKFRFLFINSICLLRVF